ncbi:hypothetical protein GCM10022267_84960 [Lentzea roselyniae]|uniref:Polyketide-type polyunsaturated fatty acid synthase PfaA n=1 Tax=Lentzea roselyniae TaxID=531940 RepID=A0ABP7CAI2_9PSEU
MSEKKGQTPIAIVGLGALLPGSTGVDAFWRAVVTGRDLITDVPPDRWLPEDHYAADRAASDRTYGRRGAFLPGVDFDPARYGVPPNTLTATDTSQLLALLVADRTLGDAGGLDRLDTERVSVLLGAAQLDMSLRMSHRLEQPVWRKVLRELGLPESQVDAACERIAGHYPAWQEDSFPGLLGNVVAGRIANRFDLHGTNCTVDAACASSFAALSMAIDELSLGRADLVLTGGVDTMNEPFMYLCFSKTPALSFSGDCRPFAEAADGTVLGEAVVMFALKRLADAEADHDRIYAVIRGLGSSSDGHAGAIYAPTPGGQARALRRAYAAAGYQPDTVELVEAHGTGTKVGDATEFAALSEVFTATGRTSGPWCALGSVKSQVGHTKCAAGAVGLLKAVLALHHKVLPPTIKVDRPDPQLEMDSSPLYLNTVARPWVAASGHPRRASVSSFGFGGTNFHVTVEEHLGDGQARRVRTMPDELVLASGDTAAALLAGLEFDGSLADVARRSQSTFDPAAPYRLAIVATDPANLRAKLGRATQLLEKGSFSTPDGIYCGVGTAAPGRVAFLFPGQGAQYVGMSGDLTMRLPAAQEVWTAAERELPGLRDVMFPPPAFTSSEKDDQEARLTATEWAQPALAVHSTIVLELLRALGVRPDAVAGHSFGELVALHAAGSIDAATLLSLARRRGELMRDAVDEEGAMLAVQGIADVIDALMDDAPSDLWVANHNGPAEVVLSGTLEAIEVLERKLSGRGASVKRLNTAAAFHSPLVAAASEPLRAFADEVSVVEPSLPVYGNADAACYPPDAVQTRDRLATQLASPVRFAETVEAMYAAGVRCFVEVGPGTTLTGMVGRILAGREHLAVRTDRRGLDGVTGLHQALGQLAVHGLAMDFSVLWADHAPSAVQPRHSSATVTISGGNRRLYPPPGGVEELPPPNPERSAVDARPVRGAAEAHTSSPAPAGASSMPEQRGSDADILHTLRTVIAEKTGYPLEVIGDDMDLEIDLGVDSIKRVEVLSALREKIQLGGREQATDLIKVRTIGELAVRLRGEGDAPGLVRRVLRTVPATVEDTAMPGLDAGPVMVTDDGGGVAHEMVARLEARGFAATVVSEVPSGAKRVVLLEGLRRVDSVADAIAAQRAAFRSARAVADSCAVLVTVQDTGGDFGLGGGDSDRAWLGGLAALARTAAREWPQSAVKAIDCERGDRSAAEVAEAIVTELCGGGSALDVGLRADGTRTILADTEVPARSDGGTALGPDAVLVVTGGARGVTAAAIRALARQHRPRLALIGRTELTEESADVAAAHDEAALLRIFARPGVSPAAARARARAVLAAREVRRTLAELEQTGAMVSYQALDVTDDAAVTRAVSEIRRQWGPITGIVHGAGVLADKRIGDKTDDAFDRVFGTKVAGLRALLAATAADPLRLLCAFSSVVARFGNAGQCDYAMANETLGHVLAAEAARRPGCLVRSLLWGPWQGGMVRDALAAHFHHEGIPLIQEAAGAAAFVTELATGPGAVPVMLVAEHGVRGGSAGARRFP